MFPRDFPFLRIRFFVNERCLLDRIARTEQQNAFARQTVAPRTPGFLIIALDVFRQIVVDDKTHVRFVDAHAERDGRADDPDIVAQKKFLMFAAFLGREAGVIRFGPDAVFVQALGHAFGCLAREAINDAAFLRTRAQKFKELIERLVFGDDAISKIRPVETGDVRFRLVQLQMVDDVLAHAAGGGGGERHERDGRKMFSQFRNLAVFGAEIVAPFADAMRLVNGDEFYIPASQVIEKTGKHQPLGRDVEQAEFAVVQTVQAFPRFVGIER